MATSSHRKAFTLIELLVVISIISLLVSILLPALRTARETARGSRCLSNERQVTVAFTAYAEESEGRYPSFSWPGHDKGYFWWQRMAAGKYFPVTNDFESIVMCPAGADQMAPFNEWTNPVSNDPKVDPSNAGYLDPTWGSKFQIANYGVNTYSNSGNGDANNRNWNNKCWPVGYNHADGRVGLPIHQVKNASKLLLMFDGTGMNPNHGGKWSLRHPGLTANISFVDGHATAVQQDRVPNWYYDEWGQAILVNEDPGLGTLDFMINDVRHTMW